MRTLSTIFWLATKELRSLFRDWVLLGLVVYSFSLAIIAQAQSNAQADVAQRSTAALQPGSTSVPPDCGS